jgi:hypothetical protein
MPQFEQTTTAALELAGFEKVADHGRIELWTGTNENQESVMKLFDDGTGFAQTLTDPDLNKMAAQIFGLGLVLRDFIALSTLTTEQKDLLTGGIMGVLQA